MAKKKAVSVPAEETKTETAIDVTAMNIYECQALIEQLNDVAATNDGELTEEQLQSFVAAQTQNLASLGKLVGAIKLIEQGCDYCKAEEKRIAINRKRAENRLANIIKYLTPYVKQQGKIQVGTFTLSIRKSTSVEVAEGFNDPFFCRIDAIKKPSAKIIEAARIEKEEAEKENRPVDFVIQTSPDKTAIKALLESGETIRGCELIEKDNLQIK